MIHWLSEESLRNGPMQLFRGINDFAKSNANQHDLQQVLKDCANLWYELLYLGLEKKQVFFIKDLDQTVIYIKETLGVREAFQFAHKFVAKRKLAWLAYIGDDNLQKEFVQIIKDWQNYLDDALNFIYIEDGREIRRQQKLKQQRPTDYKDGFNSEYRGLQIFKIFENDFSEELEKFLGNRNIKLQLLFKTKIAKSKKESEIANMQVFVEQQSKDIATKKVLSQIGQATIQCEKTN